MIDTLGGGTYIAEMPQGAKKAVVLLSGGLDSATVAALACGDGYEVIALSFDYGQRQKVELDAARRVAESLGIREHRVLSVDLASYGGSALTADIEVPKDRTDEEIGGGVPVTYVPARNTILLAHALGLAEAVGAFDIFIGVNAVDFSGYPDCRPAFVQAFEQLANIATGAGTTGRGTFRVHAPLLRLTKAEIIRRGVELGVDFGMTHSCYDPVGELACGRCDACLLRRRGFEAAGVQDPTRYATALQERSAV